MDRRTFINLSAGAGLASISDISYAANLFPPGATDASVTVYPKKELGRIDKKIYGHFLEHVEDVVYKGIYDPGSPLSDDMGLRLDVIDAIKKMGGAHVLRWPGGNFVSYYHWKDAIGPKKQRPTRFDVVWKNYESNQFGTDEYLALCRKLDCEPFITANMGNGTIDEACQWVEYCRGSKKKPPVKIWGLGNEHFGPWQVGYYTAEEYGRKAQQYGQFMQSVQKDLKLVGVGFTEPDWNEKVLKECGHLIDWLSVHIYGHRNFLEGVDDFDTIMATPVIFEQQIKQMTDTLEAYEKNNPRKEPIKICLEEWNDRHKNKNQLLRSSPRNIVDALFVANIFNVCQRMCDRVTMTNYVFLLNAHAPIVVMKDAIIKSATYDVYRLYAEKMQPVAVDAQVKCPLFSADISTPPAWHMKTGSVTAKRLDVSATRSLDGKKLTLSLINLDKINSSKIKLDIKDTKVLPGVTWHTLNSADLNANNSVQYPNKVRSVTNNIQVNLNEIVLKPHSLNIIELSLDV